MNDTTMIVCLTICYSVLVLSIAPAFWMLCRLVNRLSVSAQQESRQAFHLLERNLEWMQMGSPELRNTALRIHSNERMHEVAREAEVAVEEVKAKGGYTPVRDEDLTDPSGIDSIGQ